METLNLPTYPFKIKSEGNRKFIFDEFRKKNVVLTPEEWVRQHFAKFLVEHKNYPQGRIAIEHGIELNKMAKRSDIVFFNSLGEPYLIVECKSTNVKISQDTFDQVARYNIMYKAKILVVTNGLDHYCCEIDYEKNNYKFLEDIPDHSV